MSDINSNPFASLISPGKTQPIQQRMAADYRQPTDPLSARSAYKDRLCGWILRILSGQGHMPLHAEVGSTRLRSVAQLIGVPELADPQATGPQVQAAIAAACAKYPNLATELPAVTPCPMADTMAWLCQSAGLTRMQADIFELTVAFRAFSPLRQALQTWGPIYSSDYTHAIAVLVGHDEQEVELALHPGSALIRSGLVKSQSENYDEGHLYTMLSVSRGLAHRIEHNKGQAFEVMDRLVAAMPKPQLTLQDFAHLANHTQLAQSWLYGALARSKRQSSAGHMLVSGAPGLGKTEWVRALLDAARNHGTVHPLEMAVLATNGRALNGEERLDNLRLALNVFRNAQGGVLLFDEADDVFEPSGPFVSSSTETNAYSMANHRAAINRLVEESRIPIIWIMNNTDVLDPAVLRRFDVVFNLEAMPRSVRAKLLKTRLPQHWDTQELADWSDVQSLTPALIDRLAVIQHEASDAGKPLDAAQCRHWLRQRLPGNATRKLARYERSRGTATQLTTTNAQWNPEWVNASYDLLELAEGIRRSGFGRILLHGLPGTGKTAYAYELARRLDLPIREQRASDLLSPYVGETEQRIAKAFESAAQDEAVLFLDEADSLLSIRNHAHRNWEVTQVNEILQQLADFDGVVVLATNRTDALDPAVLRRLDARIAFLPLTATQIEKRFTALCTDLGLDECPLFEQAAMGPAEMDVAMHTSLRKVSSLHPLTPGDFDVLQRRHAFAPFTSAQALADALTDEVRAKPGVRVAIGFYQSNRDDDIHL